MQESLITTHTLSFTFILGKTKAAPLFSLLIGNRAER